jgi:glycosyltransferase involved in cell wall biosynthesis
MKTKVAIFQNTITGGGRIRVLNEIIRALNELKVKPDIYAYKINTAISGNMNIRKCFPVVYGLYELKVLSLNLRMRFIAPKYDLCINSNNTILFAPANDAISYIHFPREARILSVYEKTGAQKSSPTAYERLLTSLFRYRRYNENNKIIANSSYTKSIIERVYPEIRPSDISVLYPPIYPKEGSPDRKKRDVVCTLGRFSLDKRQLEQIQIAERLPDLQFEIMGFVGDRNGRIYFNKCQNYVKDNRVTNVTLFPSLAYEEVDDKPVVHDSGGQREIVPIGALRFSNAAAAIDILKDTDRLDTGEIQRILRENIKRFEVNRFREQIFSILEEKLN